MLGEKAIKILNVYKRFIEGLTKTINKEYSYVVEKVISEVTNMDSSSDAYRSWSDWNICEYLISQFSDREVL